VLKTPGDTSGLDGKLGLTGVNPQFFGEFAPAGLTQIGGNIAYQNAQERIQSPVRDNALDEKVTLIRGSHQLKFGVEYRSSLSTEGDFLLAGGYFTFNNVATGSALAAMLLGWADIAEVQETEPLHARASTHALFAQDDWKVTPRLTLNLGVRWDIDTPRWEQMDRQNGFNETAINPVCNCPGVVTFAGQNGLGKYAHNWDWKDFGPRVGFAYRFGDTWVMRGGAAQLYIGQYDQATPTYAALGFQATTALTSPDNGLTPAAVLSKGLPPLLYPSPSQLTAGYGAVPPGATPTTAVDFFYPTGRKEGYLEQYNFNMQHQITRNLVAEIGYLATLGHHLSSKTPLTIDQVPPSLMGPGNAQINRPFPQFSNVSEDVPDIGNSSYNAMNVRLEKSWSHGLLFQANYTWSRLIDDLAARNELGGNTTDFQNVYDRAADRGLSGNSISHRMVLSTVYAVPAGAGRGFDARNRFMNGVIGGWSLGYIAVLQTGPPWGAVDLTNTTNSFSPAQRPNVVGNPNNLSSERSKAQQLAEWFNTSAFAVAAPYTFGDAGRTDGFGPGLISMDISILREFRIHESHTLEFRMEMLNFLNHANFANPNTSVGSPAFGQVTSLITGNQSRIIQFALHYKF